MGSLVNILAAENVEDVEVVGGGPRSCQVPSWIVKAETRQEQDLVSMFILQMRERKPHKVGAPAQGHSGNRKGTGTLTHVSLTLEACIRTIRHEFKGPQADAEVPNSWYIWETEALRGQIWPSHPAPL